jgi:hypothetical protein
VSGRCRHPHRRCDRSIGGDDGLPAHHLDVVVELDKAERGQRDDRP